MLGLPALRDEPRELPLIELGGILEPERVGGHGARDVCRHHGDDDARIDAAGQRAGHRHIAQHPARDGGLEPAAHQSGELVRGDRPPRFIPGRRSPVPPGAQASAHEVEHEAVRGGKLVRGSIDGEWRGHALKAQVMRQCLRAQPGIEARQKLECLELGGECESARVDAVVKWFDAEVIASPEEYPAAAIVDHEGEHAVQALEHALAFTHVQVQQHFGVRVIGDETRAVPLQPAAQLRCVHDLAIEDDADLSVRAQHRLAPAGEVDDAEAAHGEADRRFHAAIFSATHNAMLARMIDLIAIGIYGNIVSAPDSITRRLMTS